MPKKCAWEGCTHFAYQNSKYCFTHKQEARKRFKEMVSAKGEERDERNTKFEAVYQLAMIAARKAAQDCVPTPIMVVEHVSVLDDSSPIKSQEYVAEGVCGYAFALFKPATSSFARFLIKKGYGRTNSYLGGCSVSMDLHSQSYERHTAALRAFIYVIHRELPELKVYGHSDLD